MKAKVFVTAFVLGLCYMAVAAACSEEEEKTPAVVGDWEAADEWCGYKDELEIEDDLKGDARIYLICDNGTAYYCDYDVEVEKDGDVWVFDLECDADSSADFEMECEVDGDDMECEGSDGALDGVDFEWERQ